MSAPTTATSSATTSSSRADRPATAATVRLTIRADATPGTLPRIVEQLALRNLVPTRMNLDQLPGDALMIDIWVRDVSDAVATRLAARCRAIIGVTSVVVVS